MLVDFLDNSTFFYKRFTFYPLLNDKSIYQYFIIFILYFSWKTLINILLIDCNTDLKFN